MSNGCGEYRLEEMSWPRAQAAIVGGATAVVPVGSLEQHGRHLALNTDNVIADAIGEPWITPHTARHSFASTLFRQGIRINVVSKLLGHKDVATTYKIYIHMIPEEMDEAVDAVGKVIMGV